MSILIIQNGIPCGKIEACIKRSFETMDKNITIINMDKHKLNQYNDEEINNLYKSVIGVIITGLLMDNKVDFFKDLFFSFQIDVINTCNKENIPLVGLGIGCQLIGILFGLTQIPLFESRNGFGFLDVASVNKKIIEDDIFLGSINYNKLSEYSFSLSSYVLLKPDDIDNIEIIATDFINNPQIIKHKNKPIYGFQDHFDVDPMTGMFFLSVSKLKNKKAIEKFSEDGKQMKLITEIMINLFCHKIDEIENNKL